MNPTRVTGSLVDCVKGKRCSLRLILCPFLQVFLKYYHVEHLNLMVQQATQRIILVQAYVRGWLGAKRYRRILKEREQSALVLQSGL